MPVLKLTMARTNIFERFPVEVITMIYGAMSDLKDVKATLSTCKRAKEVFENNSGAIAKDHILRIIGNCDLKLAVMAVVSREVDPTGRESVERFFQEYLWETDEWPTSYFTMNIACALPLLMVAARSMARCNEDTWGASFSPARVTNTCFMVETAINLFHKTPGSQGKILWRAPQEDLAEKYWLTFSVSEIRQVMHSAAEIFEAFQRSIRYYYERKDTNPDCAACRLRDYDDLDWSEDVFAKAFSYIVGIGELHTWVYSEKSRSMHIHRLYEEYYESLLEDDDVERHSLIGVAERCMKMQDPSRGRFRPESKALNEVIWQSLMANNKKGYLKLYSWCEADPKLCRGASFWDMTTVMDYAEWKKRGVIP